jgi:hypothetical protein
VCACVRTCVRACVRGGVRACVASEFCRHRVGSVFELLEDCLRCLTQFFMLRYAPPHSGRGRSVELSTGTIPTLLSRLVGMSAMPDLHLSSAQLVCLRQCVEALRLVPGTAVGNGGKMSTAPVPLRSAAARSCTAPGSVISAGSNSPNALLRVLSEQEDRVDHARLSALVQSAFVQFQTENTEKVVDSLFETSAPKGIFGMLAYLACCPQCEEESESDKALQRHRLRAIVDFIKSPAADAKSTVKLLKVLEMLLLRTPMLAELARNAADGSQDPDSELHAAALSHWHSRVLMEINAHEAAIDIFIRMHKRMDSDSDSSADKGELGECVQHALRLLHRMLAVLSSGHGSMFMTQLQGRIHAHLLRPSSGHFFFAIHRIFQVAGHQLAVYHYDLDLARNSGTHAPVHSDAAAAAADGSAGCAQSGRASPSARRRTDAQPRLVVLLRDLVTEGTAVVSEQDLACEVVHALHSLCEGQHRPLQALLRTQLKADSLYAATSVNVVRSFCDYIKELVNYLVNKVNEAGAGTCADPHARTHAPAPARVRAPTLWRVRRRRRGSSRCEFNEAGELGVRGAD